MSWLEQKLKDWGVLELTPEEQTQQEVQTQAQTGEQEMQPIREEKTEKEKAEDDLKLVIDGAKLECKLCATPEGTLKVNLDTPSTQDKRTATIAEKDFKSLVFDGNCTKSINSSQPCKSVMKLEDWKDIGKGKVQDNEPLLLKSTIMCSFGGGSITITDCGQKHEPEELEIKGVPLPIDEDPEKVKYVVTFERLPLYNESKGGKQPNTYRGEFGFDWMRKEYLPVEEGGQGICVEGLEGLKKLYDPFEMDIKDQDKKPYGNYYSPWISMFPNHKEKIGKEVQLIMKVDFDFMENSIPDEEMMTFESSDSGITGNVVQNVYNASTGKGDVILVPSATFNSVLNGVIIQINCTSELTEDATIDVVASDGLVVGRLNVMKNKSHTINIPVVFAYIKDMGDDYNRMAIENEINKVGGIQAIEDYLNRRSLNQALIQVKFQYLGKDNVGDIIPWVFRKQSLVNASSEGEYKGMVVNTSTMEVKTKQATDYFNDRLQLSQNYSHIFNEKNIILYLTSLTSDSAGGASYNNPLDNKNCIIFKNNIDHLSSYAHEIGHTLGLEHTFLDGAETNDAQITNAQNELPEYKQKKRQAIIDKRNHLNTNQAYYNSHPNEKKEAIKTLDYNISIYDKAIKNQQAEIEVLKKNLYKYKKRSTENIMDYDLSNQKVFYYWQWNVMLKEAKKYYI